MVNCGICGKKLCDQKECLFLTIGSNCPSLKIMESDESPCYSIKIKENDKIYDFINCCNGCKDQASFKVLPKHIKNKILIEEL